MNRLAAAMLFVAIGSGLAYCGGVMETVSLEKVSFNGIKKLRVDASLFGVEITGSNRDSVDMEVRMPRELLERYEVQHAQEGSALVVRVVQKKIGLLGFHGELRVVFQVPRAIDLDITTASGDQVVRAMACRNATLRSSSGDIDARDIEAGFQAASSSGSIELENITGPMSARSSSGDIRIKTANGDLAVETSSGKIRVEGFTGDIKAHASSGDHIYTNVTGDIIADTSSGTITVDRQEGELDLRSSSGDLVGRGVTLTGSSHFQTSSGRIDFQFDNAVEQLSFDLRSSSGQLTAGNTQAKERLTTGQGPIKVTGQSSSGDQSYK